MPFKMVTVAVHLMVPCALPFKMVTVAVHLKGRAP